MSNEMGAPVRMQCVDRKPKRRGRPPKRLADDVGEQLAGLLPDEAPQDALRGLDTEQITGPGGLITQLAGRVIEAALGAELSENLGYPPGPAPPGGAGNVRNGSTPKTLATDLGELAIRTPRDRDASFEPRLVGKRQTRLAGLDDKILALYAGGLSVREIETQLGELYGVAVGRDTISRVTDAVLADVQAWCSRPLQSPVALLMLSIHCRTAWRWCTRRVRCVARCCRRGGGDTLRASWCSSAKVRTGSAWSPRRLGLICRLRPAPRSSRRSGCSRRRRAGVGLASCSGACGHVVRAARERPAQRR